MLHNHKYNHDLCAGFIYQPKNNILYYPSLRNKIMLNFQTNRLWRNIVYSMASQNVFIYVLSHKDYEKTGNEEIAMHLSDSRKHLRRSN
jgi:hypothetical protein